MKMRKYIFLASALAALAACDKHDPILPGTRNEIFTSNAPNILNTAIKNLPQNIAVTDNGTCPYTQDASNIIRNGDKKIFTGFPTSNSVKSNQKPVCHGGYVYAGLTTGEMVKINPQNRQIMWIADIYKSSNLTGGASMLDIVAPIIIQKNAVYVGGLGDAFCRVSATGGNKKWCLDIGVSYPFIVTDDASFVVANDGNLYAIRNEDGAVYWRTNIKDIVAPTYENKIISVGKEQFDASTGDKIK